MMTDEIRPRAINNQMIIDPRFSRRQFLKLGGVLAAGLIIPRYGHAIPHPQKPGERILKFFNTHTQEHLEVCYASDGEINPQAVQAVNTILRDHRTDEVHPIDVRLLDLLHAIRLKAGQDSCLHIISGYRSPTTNANLRRRGRGVARKSLHMRGQAADIRIPGIAIARLRKIALRLARGGVGYYPAANFVHVDIGRVRAW